jgi:four helix bundle protein
MLIEPGRRNLGRRNLGRRNLGRRNLGRRNLGRRNLGWFNCSCPLILPSPTTPVKGAPSSPGASRRYALDWCGGGRRGVGMNVVQSNKPYRSRLRVLNDTVAMVARVHRVASRIGCQDRELKDQLERASTSVALNAAEGAHAMGKRRRYLLNVAMCSGREAIMALRIAAAKGQLDAHLVAVEVDNLDRIVATLYKLAARKPRTG